VTVAYIGIGSNVGDRDAQLVAARDALHRLPRTQLTGQSHVYETEPVGPVDQGPFLNAVVRVDTDLVAGQLLEHLFRIERDAGRERRARWGPRTLDLDLLLFGDRVISHRGRRTDDLVVPHPLMHERAFVLRPLCDIDADVEHPRLRMRCRTLLDALNAAPLPRREVADW
jgi:2-amino-4-hydroxy-6-hydroxymethyldihydropteridine diphosphokinase